MNTIFHHKFCRPFWIACLSYFFRPQYVWFPSYLYVKLIPNSSGQLAELINCLYNSTKVDLYSHQILLVEMVVCKNDSRFVQRRWVKPKNSFSHPYYIYLTPDLPLTLHNVLHTNPVMHYALWSFKVFSTIVMKYVYIKELAVHHGRHPCPSKLVNNAFQAYLGGRGEWLITPGTDKNQQPGNWEVQSGLLMSLLDMTWYCIQDKSITIHPW